MFGHKRRHEMRQLRRKLDAIERALAQVSTATGRSTLGCEVCEEAADLLAAMERVARTVHVKGIEREIVVHALRTRR